MTAQTFRNRCNRLPKKLINEDGSEHRVWIVTVSFCAVRYVNDTMYYPEGTIFTIETLGKPRKNDMQFFSR